MMKHQEVSRAAKSAGAGGPLGRSVAHCVAVQEGRRLSAIPYLPGAFPDGLPAIVAGGEARRDWAVREGAATSKPRRELLGINDFRVPRHYLSYITGKEWAERVLAAEVSQQDQPVSPHYISSVNFVRFSQQYMRTVDSETWAGGPQVPIGTFSLLVAAAAQAIDLADALRRTVEAIGLVRPDLVAELRRGRHSLSFSIASRPPAGPLAPANVEVGVEFLVLALHCALRWLSGEPLRPSSVRAAQDQAGHRSSLLRILCCPLRRGGTGVTIEYPLSGSDRPLPLRRYDAYAAHELSEFFKLLEEAVSNLAPPKLRGEYDIVGRIEAMLQGGTKGEPRIAARLGLSTASLRRRMAETGTTYRQVLERFRREQVRRLLQTERPLADVACEAGFSDARSLRRACIKWFGAAPGQLRKDGLPRMRLAQ